MKNPEKNQEEIVLLGAEEIEKQLRRSMLILMGWKTGYNFPLRKTCGQPSVSMKELEAWVKEWGRGRPFNKITNDMLWARKRRLDILAMPSKPLESIDKIVKFTGCLQHEVLNWHKYGSDCPIQRDKKKGFSVDGKDLLLWMHENNILGNQEVHNLGSF